MLFDAPRMIRSIPDMKQIYAINEEQESNMDASVNALFDNIFLETMDETKTARWEKMLSLNALDTDTLEERRFRVRSKVLERLPYSYRIILRKLQALCPHGIELLLDTENESIIVKVALTSKAMRDDVDLLLDAVLPLNMTYEIIILYNTYLLFSQMTEQQMSQYTELELREKEIFRKEG